ncbi:MAG: chemotaxis protein CheD [Pseudomonadota bacterium]
MTNPLPAHPTPSSTSRPNIVHVIQGDCEVSDDPNTVFSTILGSCIAACIWDPMMGIGGMNHFLLPDGEGSGPGSQKYGAYAMECLINGLLRRGAHRQYLEAKIFGGSRMMKGIGGIGSRNVAFVQGFLRAEGISIVAQDVGGDKARRVKFWGATGVAKLKWLESSSANEDIAPVPPVTPAPTGDVELF